MTTAYPRSLRLARGQAGFSLIEILIVMVLIGGVMALVANQVFGGRDQANVGIAKTQVQNIGGQIELYQMHTGSLPNSLADLVRQPSGADGWLGPYVRRESDLKDPWGRELVYTQDSSSSVGFSLMSLGKDGRPGGQSHAADIAYGD